MRCLYVLGPFTYIYVYNKYACLCESLRNWSALIVLSPPLSLQPLPFPLQWRLSTAIAQGVVIIKSNARLVWQPSYNRKDVTAYVNTLSEFASLSGIQLGAYFQASAGKSLIKNGEYETFPKNVKRKNNYANECLTLQMYISNRFLLIKMEAPCMHTVNI